MCQKTDDFINIIGDLQMSWFKEPTPLRFGQYVFASGKLAGMIPDPWPELFYETDWRTAYAMLYGHARTVAA